MNKIVVRLSMFLAAAVILLSASKVAECRAANIALNKPATMSSQYAPGYEASLCVDGVGHGLCHTTKEQNPWWQVDLGSVNSIGYIVVTNRTDCCGERERTLTALISTDGKNWQLVYDNAGKDFTVLSIPVNGRQARYVRLQLRATDYMNLVQVAVFPYEGESGATSTPATMPNPANLAAAGSGATSTLAVLPKEANTPAGEYRSTNIALHKPASMSSQYAPGYEASLCVDGVGHGLCHTTQEQNPWWQVDLGAVNAIGTIVVTNRTDCCGERERTLTALVSTDGKSWQLVYDNAGKDFKVLSIPLNGRLARYVRLQLHATDWMNLVQVAVFPYEGPK